MENGLVSLSNKSTITDTGNTTKKTETTSAKILTAEGVNETTTEIDQRTNKVISTNTKKGVKVPDVGIKAGFIVAGEIKFDMKKVEEALRKLIHE